MKLKQWLKSNNISNKDFAKMAGVHFSYVSHINKGRRVPSPKVALKIQTITNADVTVLELLYPDANN